MSTDTDELEPHEQAFADEKAGRELFGIELRPYTPSRKVAAERMGMVYPFVDVEESVMEKRGYPGLLTDAIIVTWLCSLPDEGSPWDPFKAHRRPQEAEKVAVEWAGQHGVTDIGSKAYREAVAAFMSMVTAQVAGQFIVTVEGSGGGAEGGSPNV